MPTRQTRNVSLPPHQNAFVDGLVQSGRYRTASEVVRDALRLLEEAEHRRLIEKWIYRGLAAEDEEKLPVQVRERARAYFQELVDEARRDIERGDVADGPAVMKRLRDVLEAGSD